MKFYCFFEIGEEPEKIKKTLNLCILFTSEIKYLRPWIAKLLKEKIIKKRF